MTDENPNIIPNKQLKLEERAMPILQLRALRRGVLRSCLNCDHYITASEGCGIGGGARPPAMVIFLGCDSWVEQIPF